MSGEHNVAALLQQENADLRGQVTDLETELRCTEGDLAVATDEATRARSGRQVWVALWKKAADGVLALTAERDELQNTLRAARDYVGSVWGRAEQAAEQVNRIPAAGVAQAFADLADILGSDE